MAKGDYQEFMERYKPGTTVAVMTGRGIRKGTVQAWAYVNDWQVWFTYFEPIGQTWKSLLENAPQFNERIRRATAKSLKFKLPY